MDTFKFTTGLMLGFLAGFLLGLILAVRVRDALLGKG